MGVLLHDRRTGILYLRTTLSCELIQIDDELPGR
jgi:hypothetical protein